MGPSNDIHQHDARQKVLVRARLFDEMKRQLLADGWSNEDATRLAKARVRATVQ